jgi:ribosomal protein L22
MAEEKKDTEKKQSSTRRSTSKKSSGSSGGGRKTTAKSGSSGTRQRKSSGTRSSAKPKTETATRGEGAAEATSKAADSRASDESTTKAPAKKAEAKKPAAKKEPAKSPEKTAATKTAAESKETAKAPARKRAKKEAPERPVVNARARFVRVAPRKARLVADQVRGLHLDDALPLLRFSTRSAAQDIRKLLESAAANAEANHDLVADDLMIKDIHVDEGPTLRRYRPRALGRATRINKRTSHIAVALTPEE